MATLIRSELHSPPAGTADVGRVWSGIIPPLAAAAANLAVQACWAEQPHQQAPGRQLLWFVLGATAVLPLLAVPRGGRRPSRAIWDLCAAGGFLLLVWQVAVGRTSWLPPYLFPSPARVFYALQSDYKVLLQGVWSSGMLLVLGYGLALAAAIPAGLAVGWHKRLAGSVLPAAKVISPIPPTVYVPYAIALLPSFFASSVLVIFIGSFWPIFINTVQAVRSVDQRLIDSARTLCLPPRTFLARVLLPASTPGILTGAMLGLVFSFIMLTIAEMIGAKSGLGWYVQYYADFAQYDRVIAGIVFVGLVVAVLVTLFERLQHHLLRWQGDRRQ